jgi:hypothetical protein
MRTSCWTRWAISALALSICVPVALADRGTKSVSTCASFNQADKGDDKVEFKLQSSCSVPLDCSISWRVVCAPESKKRRAEHAGATKLALLGGSSQTAEASAAVCGDAGWAFDSIAWSCQPNKD